MYQRNSSGPRFPKRESRARTSTRNQSYSWISSLGSFSDPNCQENPQYSNLVRAYTTLGASDTGIHWRSTQTCSEGSFFHNGASQKGVSPLNRAPNGISAKVIDTGKHWTSTQMHSEDGFSNSAKSQKGVSPLNRAPNGISAKVIDTGKHWTSTQMHSEDGFSNSAKSQKGVSPLNRSPNSTCAKVIDTGKHWTSTQMYSEDGFSNSAKSQKGVSPLNRAPNGASAKVIDTGKHWTSTQMYSEDGFSNTAKSQKGVSPLNRAPNGTSAKVISHKEEPVWSSVPGRDAFATTVDDVKTNIQPSTSGHKAELRIEQVARIALPSSPSDEDISDKMRVITPEQVSDKTTVIATEQLSDKMGVTTPEQVSDKMRVITPGQVSNKTRVITPEQVSTKKQPSNTAAATVAKPSSSQPCRESASTDLEARRQLAIKMILELQRQEMEDSEDESCSDSDSSGWETASDSCSAASSATSIADTVNAPTYPDENSRLTAILRARLAAGHIPQARKSKNAVSLDDQLHAIRYKPQPRAFAPWFDEDMVDYDNNVICLLRPPARPRAPYEGDVIATLVPPMSKLSLKHTLNTDSHDGRDDEHVAQVKGKKRQHDDAPEVGGIKRSRTLASGTHEPIRAVTYGKRKAVEFADTLHAAKRTRN